MNQDIIWDAYQNNKELMADACHGGQRIDFMVSKIKSGSHILNIGVGRAELEEKLIAKQVIVSALDPSKITMKKLKNRLKANGGTAKIGYSQDIPWPDKSFDYVVMAEVIEHLE
jgi:2-polyprenyl-3-methyl-5-hydroxy-6-metoxy-1,4-benzoquinol methylase